MAMTIDEIIERTLDRLPKSNSLPDPSEVSYYALEEKRKIYLDYDICEDAIEIQKLIMRWNMEDSDIPEEKCKPIWIYIMSYGGDLAYMWMLIDTIRMSRTPIYTVNLGIAGSAAGLIFLAGKKRFMLPNSILVIHEGHAELSGDAVKVMDASEAYKKDLKKMKVFIENNTSIPHSAIIKKRNNDWYLDAEYCLENKACECIVDRMIDIL